MVEYKRYYTKNQEHKLATHRKIWEDKFGKIPEGFIIHHKNGNKRDNRIENLEMISHKEHSWIHFGRINKDGVWVKKCRACQNELPKEAFTFITKNNSSYWKGTCKSCINKRIADKHPATKNLSKHNSCICPTCGTRVMKSRVKI